MKVNCARLEYAMSYLTAVKNYVFFISKNYMKVNCARLEYAMSNHASANSAKLIVIDKPCITAHGSCCKISTCM